MPTAIGAVLDEVRQRLPLTEYLVSKGHALRQTGRNRMVGLCPFHPDKHRPNMVIYVDEQRFHCFTCGQRGDLVDMVQHLEGHRDFTATLRALADKLHVSWPELPPAKSMDSTGVLTLAAKLYADHLSSEARAYVGSRGFPEPFARHWRIGYAPPNSPQFLRNLLKQHNVTPGVALASGVVVEAGARNGRFVRDFFGSGGGYVILPNPGRRGLVVDLQGRAFPDDSHKPKYLNLPRGRRYLFNESILPQVAVVLTEGIPDALSCLLAGQPAVAVYGTAGFSPRFVSRFARCRRVYVAFDLDVYDRSIDVAMQFGLRGRVLVLPDRLGRKGDLNDLLVALGPEGFAHELELLLRTAATGYAMAINTLTADLDPHDLFETAAPLLAAVGSLDPISRDTHLELLHTKYGLAMQTLRDAAVEALALLPSGAVGGGADASAERFDVGAAQ
jgi:DNA primase